MFTCCGRLNWMKLEKLFLALTRTVPPGPDGFFWPIFPSFLGHYSSRPISGCTGVLLRSANPSKCFKCFDGSDSEEGLAYHL